MSDQLTNNPEALRLFFTEDIFLVDRVEMATEAFSVAAVPASVKKLKAEALIPVLDLPGSTALQISEVEVMGIRQQAESLAAQAEVRPAAPAIALPQVPAQQTPPDPKQTPPAAQQTPPASQHFKHVGSNERNVLILVHDEVHPVSTLAGRELLGNILKAIKLQRDDCALVNYASYNGTQFSEFQSFFDPQYVFAFGVSPEQLGLSGAAYNSIVAQGTCKLIFSSNLDALSSDPATKKLLWASLQQIQLNETTRIRDTQ